MNATLNERLQNGRKAIADREAATAAEQKRRHDQEAAERDKAWSEYIKSVAEWITPELMVHTISPVTDGSGPEKRGTGINLDIPGLARINVAFTKDDKSDGWKPSLYNGGPIAIQTLHTHGNLYNSDIGEYEPGLLFSPNDNHWKIENLNECLAIAEQRYDAYRRAKAKYDQAVIDYEEHQRQEEADAAIALIKIESKPDGTTETEVLQQAPKLTPEQQMLDALGMIVAYLVRDEMNRYNL